MSNGIDEIGGIQWQVALCLLLAWTLTFLALSKGVKSVGKVTTKALGVGVNRRPEHSVSIESVLEYGIPV